MSVNGQRDGRPLLYARDDDEARRIYYYILWPNLIVSVHPDYVLTHQAWPDGPNRSTVHCDLYVEADKVDTLDVSGAVEFWDITNREDYHVVELQQQGTRSRSWTAGRYSNQEASVHAFDIMVADRYANDGSHTVRGWRTETAAERRLVTRRLGPAQQAEAAEAAAVHAERRRRRRLTGGRAQRPGIAWWVRSTSSMRRTVAVGDDLEVALAELGGGLARVAPGAGLGRAVDGAGRREEERGVDGRAAVGLRERRELAVGLAPCRRGRG